MRTWPLLLALLVAGCTPNTEAPEDQPRVSASSPVPSSSSHPGTPTTPASTVPANPEGPADARWVFFTKDQQRYESPWFAGAHRIMIPFGCTPAPYYDPDPSCPDGQGFHHGIDVAIPCGTELYAGRPAQVLANDALGPAYGENPVLLRVRDRDIVIGHTRRVFVGVGDTVEVGERFALIGDSAAPDGCHLHFEVRPRGAGYLAALDPLPFLDLAPSS